MFVRLRRGQGGTEEARGQVVVLFAIFSVVLLLAAALAVDYTSWLLARRDYQAVSDAASLAGAAQLPASGTTTPTVTQQRYAWAEAMVYLSDHLGLGIDRATAVSEAPLWLDKPAPYVAAGNGGTYCIWIWTPTPPSTEMTTSGSECAPSSVPLYAPATYPQDGHKVFVRVQSERPGYFGNVANIRGEVVSAISIAGSIRGKYAVMALKPRVHSPDNVQGITITGNSTLNVASGDVGGSYTLAWGGSGASIQFSPGLDQAVDLMEPQSVQGIGSVVNGTIQQLPAPLEDPGYMSPAPAWCNVAVTDPCGWAWPPSTGGKTGNGVYPECATASDIANHRITCTDGPTITIWPGMYEYIDLKAGVTATFSPTCFPGDTACTTDGRAGIFYFRDAGGKNPKSGLYLTGTSTKPTIASGCGIFLMFDPAGGKGQDVQLNLGGVGTTLAVNDLATCSMQWNPGQPAGTIPYKWYGGNNADLQNPVSIWVRPNGAGKPLKDTDGGSSVIQMAAGSTIQESGVVYGPEDNTIVAGGPSGSGVGQIVAWTVVYTGGSTITERYQGPYQGNQRLYQ